MNGFERVQHKTAVSQSPKTKTATKETNASTGNRAELEIMKSDMRKQSDEVRNTVIKCVDKNKLPYSNANKSAEFDFSIDADRNENIYLGKNDTTEKVVAAINPRGFEEYHQNENRSFNINSAKISQSLPEKRNTATIEMQAKDRASARKTLSNVEESKDANRLSGGVLKETLSPVSAKNNVIQQESIENRSKNSDGKNRSDLQKISDISQSVLSRKEQLQHSVENKIGKLINDVDKSEKNIFGNDDDYFDFLRRRHEDDESEEIHDIADISTKGDKNAGNNQTGS